MLSSLTIKNIAVISGATITLSEGLNVFTGETGAGKTILIGAINAVLGARTSRGIIRTGEDTAYVEAVFSHISPENVAVIEGMGYPVIDGQLRVSRELSTDPNKGSCKIGKKTVTATVLRRVGDLLINVHGQQDNQQLLSAQKHLEYIDSFGQLESLRGNYHTAFEEYTELKSQLESLSMDENIKAQRIDMLEFQIREIEAAELVDGEEEELDALRRRAKNAERVTSALAQAQAALEGMEEQQGIIGLCDTLCGGVEDAARYVEELEEYPSKLREFGYELEALSAIVREQIDTVAFDPRRLDEVEGRLDQIYRLKKKYGDSIAQMLAHCEKCQKELDSLSFSQERAQQLEGLLEQAYEKAYDIATELSQKRHSAAEVFIDKIQSELAFLDMPGVTMTLLERQKPLAADGCDDLEFLISPNPGETPRPLIKIASGGEIARIMLAVKNILSGRDSVETLIFDEVDTGVSGRAAVKIGRKLGEVGRTRQVLCVTHLAPVAAFGAHHLQISKQESEGRTHTTIQPLTHHGRIAELARITAGDQITPAALGAASELLVGCQQQLEDGA